LLWSELNIRAIVPDGAFYTMADVRDYGDDLKLAENLLEHRVITVPGIAFGDDLADFCGFQFARQKTFS
jgi:aspartate aminotransferase